MKKFSFSSSCALLRNDRPSSMLCVVAVLLIAANVPIVASLQALQLKPPANVKVLILPGFLNCANDYCDPHKPYGNSLVRSLRKRGWEDVEILPVERTDWLNIFWRGALDWRFWAGTAPPTRPAFAWYLERIAEAILAKQNQGQKVLLVGHSAGGWLARAALGYLRDVIPSHRVCGIVTLGAPHLPPPPNVMDMTRGALKLTNDDFPGAYYQDQDVFYITVAGNAVAGVPQQKSSPFERYSPTGLAYHSYQGVSGIGTSSGDGIVPVSHAHLDGATQLNLPGTFHCSVHAAERWYGSESKIDLWHDEVLRQLHRKKSSSSFAPLLHYDQSHAYCFTNRTSLK